MAQGLKVRGLANVNRALRGVEKDTAKGIRKEIRDFAEPVRESAENLASTSITNIGVPWSRMRIGVLTHSIYVAPKQRGVKGKGRNRRRPNLSPLLMNRALQPALDRHAPELERDFNRMLERVSVKFNHSGRG